MKEIEIVGEIKKTWFKEIKGYTASLAVSVSLVSLTKVSIQGAGLLGPSRLLSVCNVSDTRARTLLFLFLSSGPERLLILPIKQTIQH